MRTSVREPGVIPAKRSASRNPDWISAFAGMTDRGIQSCQETGVSAGYERFLQSPSALVFLKIAG